MTRYRVTVERTDDPPDQTTHWHMALDYRTDAVGWRDALARASDHGYTADELPEPGRIDA